MIRTKLLCRNNGVNARKTNRTASKPHLDHNGNSPPRDRKSMKLSCLRPFCCTTVEEQVGSMKRLTIRICLLVFRWGWAYYNLHVVYWYSTIQVRNVTKLERVLHKKVAILIIYLVSGAHRTVFVFVRYGTIDTVKREIIKNTT